MKKKKLLKKYQLQNYSGSFGSSANTNFGGSSSILSTPKLKTWKPSYKLGPTGDLKFNTPKIKPFTSEYGVDYSKSSGAGGNAKGSSSSSWMDYGINMAGTALGLYAKNIQEIKQGNQLIDSIGDAKQKREWYNHHEAMNRAAGVWNSAYSDRYGNAYGNSQGKHGGYLPKHELGGTQDFSGMYGSSTYRNPESDYNRQLANMEQSDVVQNISTGMFEEHMDTAITSMPGWGAIMAAAITASKMGRGFLGEHQEKAGDNPHIFGGKDTGLTDVYYNQDAQVGSTDSEAGAAAKGGIGSAMKPMHEHAAESWGKAAAAETSGEKAKYAFEGIGDMLGWTSIPKWIKSGIDSADASQRAKVTATRTSNKSMVGGTAGYGGSGTQRINRSKVGSKFAQVKQGEMGGYLEKYKGGGYRIPSYRQGTQLGIAQEVPRDMANAEVEGGGIKRMKKGGAIKEKGETIYNAMNGTMDVVMGAKHASDSAAVQKGVPVVLQEGSPAEGGDLVFSDVAMIKDPATGKKAPASDLSIKYKDNPEILSYIATEQSRIAQIKNSKKKNGGMLKQYQQGTPTLTQAEIDALNALQGGGAPPSFIQRQQAAQQAAQTQQAPATYQAAAAQAQQQVAAQIAQSKAQTANQASSNNSLGSNWVIKNGVATMIPSSSAATTTTAATPATPAATTTPAVTSTVLPSRTGKYTGQRSKLPSQKGLNAAGQPYNFSGLNITQPKSKKGKKAQAAAAAANAAVASTKSGTPTIDDFYDDKGKLFGEKSGWQKAMDSGIIDIGLGVAGAGAQVLGAALKPNLYKNLKGPSFNPVTWEKQFFDRKDARDQYTAADRAFARGQQTILASGAGPNTSANIQALENQRVNAYENIMGREMDFNMRQDAAEKQLNAEGALRVNLANQEARFNAESAQTGINTLAAQMEMARTDALVGAGVGFANDARKTLSDMRYANAILGDGPNMNNKMDVEEAMRQLKAKYPKQAGETAAEYSSRLGQYQNMIQARLNS